MTASGLAQTCLLVLAAQFARALPGHSALKSKRAQGRPGADLAPAVCCAKGTRRRTAQQHTGGANHSAFPARWSDGLCRALPGAELSLWPPSLQRNSPATRRLTRSPPPQELGRSNDGQDHTVLPYARPAISLQFSQPCRQSRKLSPITRPSLRDGRTAYAVLSREPNFPSGLPRPCELTMPSARLGSRTSPQELDRSNDGQDHTVLPYALSAVRLHAVTSSQGLPALPATLRADAAASTATRPAFRTTREPPLFVRPGCRDLCRNSEFR